MKREHETAQLLATLRRAIEGDKRFFVIAKADPNLEPVRAHIDDLLVQLTREAKSRAEQELDSTRFAISEMEEWHAYETDSSDSSALNTMTKARTSFQSSSYFGYLDAQSWALKATEQAKSATNRQKVNMKKAIQKLEKQVSHIWKDFNKYEVKRHASTDLKAVERIKNDGHEQSQVETYASFMKAQSCFEKCLRLGFNALAKSLSVLEISELKGSTRWITVIVLLSLVLLISPVVLIWQGTQQNTMTGIGDWIILVVFIPLLFYLGLAFSIRGAIHSFRKRQSIKDKYRALLDDLKNEYTANY